MQRQRVELCQRTPHQPYHAAVGLDLAEARERIADSRAEARRLARRALVAVRRELESGGWTLAGLGVLTASGRPLPALASVLASHPLIHSAEGELFRRALLQAGRSAGIAVTALPERELERRAASHLGRPAEELSAVVSGWGRAIGPPWRREERLAGLIAWTILES